METRKSTKQSPTMIPTRSGCPAKSLHGGAADAHELEIFVGAVGQAFVRGSHRFQDYALLFVTHFVGNHDVIVKVDEHLTRTEEEIGDELLTGKIKLGIEYD